MEKEYKVPSKKQPIFQVVKKVMSWTIWRGIKVIILPETLPEKCILVANHSKKSGPMACEIALPIFTVKWGAHEMLGNYRSRRRYLIDVFYVQKQGMSRFKANLKASFEAIFSKRIFNGS